MYSKRISEQNLIMDEGGSWKSVSRPKEQIDILIKCKYEFNWVVTVVFSLLLEKTFFFFEWGGNLSSIAFL